MGRVATQKSAVGRARSGRVLRRVRGVGGTLTVLAPVLVLATPAVADTKQWTNALGTNSWSAAGNWSTGIVPVDGDFVNVTSGIALSQTVNYDFTGSFRIFNSLTVSHNGILIGTETLMITQSIAAKIEHVGDSGFLQNNNGRGVVTQNSSSNVLPAGASSQLDLGENETDQGTYNLGGTGTIELDIKGTETIGVAGIGIFNQTGGTQNQGENVTIRMAVTQTSQGIYNLSGGTLTGNVELIGIGGFAVFNHSAGTHNFGPLNSQMTLGTSTGGSGTYNLSGTGQLSLPTGSMEVIGTGGGTGMFVQTGGTHTLAGSATLQIGVGAGMASTGTYTLSAGTLITAAGEQIGVDGSGTFNQSGGTHTTTASLTLGINAGGQGTYNHSGGSLSITGSLFLGAVANSTGNYNPSGDATLSLAGSLVVGQSGTGHVSQSGGFVTAQNLAVGTGGGVGTYTLGDGTLTVLQSGMASSIESIGAAGFMTQSGGFNTTGFLHVTDGNYALNGGTLLLQDLGPVSSGLTVTGNGTFVQGGGLVTASQLTLNDQAGGQAHFNIGGGFASFPMATVGAQGPAIVNQSGGTFSVQNLVISMNGVGGYSLTGGTLSAFDMKMMAAGVTSSLTSGPAGVATITGTLTLGGLATYTGQGTLTVANVTNAGSFSQSGPMSVSGTFTNTAGSANFNGNAVQSWSNGAKLVISGGAVQLFTNPGSDTAYNADVSVTPAAGGSSILSINPTNGDLFQLRSLSVNAPGAGGNGLVVINVATGAHPSPTTHFGGAGGSVRVYIGNGTGGAGPAPRSEIEALWTSIAVDGYWAQRNGHIANVSRGITLGGGITPAGSPNGLAILSSVDDSGHTVTYLGEDVIGDTNGDAKVDINDLGAVLQHLNTTPGSQAGEAAFKVYTPGEGDVNGDLVVDINDLGTVLGNLNRVYSPAAATGGAGGLIDVPEPAGAAAIACGAAILALRRRRRA